MKAVVTGACGAIGKAIAAGLARHGFEVLMTGRDEKKLRRVMEEIRKTLPASQLEVYPADLSSEKEISDLAAACPGPVNVLVNNAATAPVQRIISVEGIEMQFAVNVLGYYRMIHHFIPLMTQRSSARIVNVASYWAGGYDPDDPEFRIRRYDNDTAYRQSKQANRMMTAGWAKTLRDSGITVNACHPGDVNSKLSNDLGFGGHETPQQGAGTPVWLAVSEEVKDMTGLYFEHRRKTACPFMQDHQLVRHLMELCASHVVYSSSDRPGPAKR